MKDEVSEEEKDEANIVDLDQERDRSLTEGKKQLLMKQNTYGASGISGLGFSRTSTIRKAY